MPASIFNGNFVKLLKSNLNINEVHDIQTGTVDPTSVAVDAPRGSKYINTTTGSWYRKNDNGSSTDWTLIGASAGYDGPASIQNMGLSASVAASALTINLKQADGTTDPTSGSPVSIAVRDVTAANGSYDVVSVTSSLSITVSSGATLGHSSGVDENIYVYLMNNGGTPLLAVSSTLFDCSATQSSTGMSAAADSASVLYEASGTPGLPIRYLGRIRVNQATAGTWATAPSLIELDVERTGYQYKSKQVFTSSGTWTKPDGCLAIEVEVVGGGGAGGSGANTGASTMSCATGGGAGGYSQKFISVGLDSTETVTVGAGGTGVAGSSGGAGGTTSFGSHVSATGGGGGNGSSAASGLRIVNGSSGGAGSTGDFNGAGGGSEPSFSDGSIAVGSGGGASLFGGGAPGRTALTTSGAVAGVAGTGYGGGGSGSVNGNSATALAGGNGADGLIIVKEYY